MTCEPYTGQLADGFGSWPGWIGWGEGVGGVGGSKVPHYQGESQHPAALPSATHFVYNACRGLSAAWPCHLDPSHGDPTHRLEVRPERESIVIKKSQPRNDSKPTSPPKKCLNVMLSYTVGRQNNKNMVSRPPWLGLAWPARGVAAHLDCWWRAEPEHWHTDIHCTLIHIASAQCYTKQVHNEHATYCYTLHSTPMHTTIYWYTLHTEHTTTYTLHTNTLNATQTGWDDHDQLWPISAWRKYPGLISVFIILCSLKWKNRDLYPYSIKWAL